MKRWIWIIGGVLVLGGLLIFTELRQKSKRCEGVIVKLDDRAEYPFFTEQDIKNLVSVNGVDRIEGMLFSEINLDGLERRVTRNRLIKKCEIYEDLSGNLVVAIQQQNPVGRLVSAASEDQAKDATKGGYLTDTGELIQLSSRFTARTVLVSGEFFNNLKNLKSPQGQNLLTFLKDLQQNPFWKSQITEVIVAKDAEMTLIPQVGQHEIDFGLPAEAMMKFEKLKIFYKNILPHQGWEKYKRVSVKFRNQIVCE
ncbi:MAG: hypothetical protein MUE30_03370 [Spirosomaceae bacterium]|jgi:cell division protein FtsQ|nr:hypothetical protein [Spirosomataceae bacterium]